MEPISHVRPHVQLLAYHLLHKLSTREHQVKLSSYENLKDPFNAFKAHLVYLLNKIEARLVAHHFESGLDFIHNI